MFGFLNDIPMMLLALPAILLSLSVHEAAHGLAAYKLGDDTAKNLGRLTLNPMKHINLFGFISMLLFNVGWANPVPINPQRVELRQGMGGRYLDLLSEDGKVPQGCGVYRGNDGDVAVRASGQSDVLRRTSVRHEQPLLHGFRLRVPEGLLSLLHVQPALQAR